MTVYLILDTLVTLIACYIWYRVGKLEGWTDARIEQAEERLKKLQEVKH